MSRFTNLLVFGLWLSIASSPASAQTATVKMVVGSARSTGTGSDRTLEEGQHLAPGTNLRLASDARVVLIQTNGIPPGKTDPPGTTRTCVRWSIISGQENYRVRPKSKKCYASAADIKLPDATTPTPFVRYITYVAAANDKADFAVPPMEKRLQQMLDSFRKPPQKAKLP